MIFLFPRWDMLIPWRVRDYWPPLWGANGGEFFLDGHDVSTWGYYSQPDDYEGIFQEQREKMGLLNEMRLEP